jgi:hypothetical protein
LLQRNPGFFLKVVDNSFHFSPISSLSELPQSVSNMRDAADWIAKNHHDNFGHIGFTKNIMAINCSHCLHDGGAILNLISSLGKEASPISDLNIYSYLDLFADEIKK